MFRVMAGDEVSKALVAVMERVAAASAARRPQVKEWCKEPRLVAVSKTKPKEMIIEGYIAGQRHFGENYIQELVNKANDPEILSRCPDIRWHMIGPVQSNKAKKVLSVPNLWIVETVHNEKLATAFNSIWLKMMESKQRTERLPVYIQVNTSGEESKSGVLPSAAPALASHVREQCAALELRGLMTIGVYGAVAGEGKNPDFLKLAEVRDNICTASSQDLSALELSMGMSGDFEDAIQAGSCNVRVGSTIFGTRSNVK